MDVLYVLGRGSQHDNIELRYSLRSIEKYASNLGRVVIVGYPPEWIDTSLVECLKVEDKYSYKHPNILRCIEAAALQNLVRGEFLYSSDDHFYIKHVDFNNYPYYKKSDHLRSTVQIWDRYRKYHMSLKQTGDLLRKHGFPDANYAQHANTHMHTEVMFDHLDIIHESYEMDFGAEPTSLVMNMWQTYPNPPSTEKRSDIKVSYVESAADLRRQIGDRECFSIGDSAFYRHCMMDFLKAEFPHKSRYEKT